MWLHPRLTVRRIIDTEPTRGFLPLSAIYGFPVLMQVAQTLSLGNTFSWPVILLTAILFSLFVGALGITLSSGLLFWVGKWIGGAGSFKEVRAAVAWSNVPTTVTCLLWIVWTLLYGQSLFFDGFWQAEREVGMFPGLMAGLTLVQLAASLWSLALLFGALAEVQRFSVWKAALNVFLLFVLLVLAMWAWMGVVGWMKF